MIELSDDGMAVMESCDLQAYGFTGKDNRGEPNEVTESDYAALFEALAKRGVVKGYVFEDDEHGRLHVHGTLLARKGLRYKTIQKEAGIHTHFEEIYNPKRWEDYLRKGFKNESIKTVAKKYYLFDP